MRITSIAYGTRGDVQPALALGRRLQDRGHKVRLVVPLGFAAMVERHGLEAAESRVDTEALLRTEGGLDLIESGKRVSLRRSLKSMQRLFEEHGPGVIDDAYQASQDADVILSSALSNVFAAAITEKLGIRQVSTMVTPVALPTRSGPATMGAPRSGTDSIVNYLLHKALIERIDWSLTQAPANRFRREVLNLPFQGRAAYLEHLRRTPVLHGVSPHVVPHPRDWPATTHTTGYWFLGEDPDWQPPRELLDFLAGGEPPVFISFGSMTARDPEGMTKLLADAVARSGRRAILQTGWAGLGARALSDAVHVLDAAPYRWLLPRVSAMVHHGGAGTTSQAMAAGIPAVAVPHMGDQPYWGARIARLGVGPRPIPRVKLTAPRLAAAIRELTTDQEMRARAAQLGAKIRAEDGLGVAARLIEQYTKGDGISGSSSNDSLDETTSEAHVKASWGM